MSDTLRLAASVIREIAVAASADPRSVSAILAGGRLRTMADARVRRVLAERGVVVVPADDVPIGCALSSVGRAR